MSMNSSSKPLNRFPVLPPIGPKIPQDTISTDEILLEMTNSKNSNKKSNKKYTVIVYNDDKKSSNYEASIVGGQNNKLVKTRKHYFVLI